MKSWLLFSCFQQPAIVVWVSDCCSVARFCPNSVISWTAASQAHLSFTISWSLLSFMSIESVMLSNHLILCCPLLLLLQFFQELGSFPVSWLFPSGGQNIVTLASASVLLMNIQGWFPIGFTGLISLLSKGLSRVFFRPTVQKHQFGTQPSYIRKTTGKTIALTTPNFVSTVMSLLFNILSILVIVRVNS